MQNETELKRFNKDIENLDRDTIKTNHNLLVLTKWIIGLTVVMIFIGIIQVFSSWPKTTYCINMTSTFQICQPDYWPYDANPNDPAYQIDKQLNPNQ